MVAYSLVRETTIFCLCPTLFSTDVIKQQDSKQPREDRTFLVCPLISQSISEENQRRSSSQEPEGGN